MHCDIVVGVMRDRILLIGGNVMNAIALTIAPSQSTGRIRSTAQRPWFGVLKLKARDDRAPACPTPRGNVSASRPTSSPVFNPDRERNEP